MAVLHRLLSLSQYFNKLTCKKIIVNDIPLTAGMNDEELLSTLLSVYESDVVSTIPRCDCPEGTGLEGRPRLGQICSICNGEVREAHDRLDSTLWLRSLSHPDYGQIPFISPIFWLIFSRQLHTSVNVDFLRYLCDDKYELPQEILTSPSFKPIQECLMTVMGGERDYLVFINKLDDIFKFFINHTQYKNKKRPMFSASALLEKFHNVYKEDQLKNKGQGVFSDYMPIISKGIFVMEKNPKGRYVWFKAAINIDVVKSWQRICAEDLEREALGAEPQSLKVKARETARVISKLSSLYLSYLNEFVFRKSGHFRKNIYGARSFFCARSVIVSIQGEHRRDDIEMPWSMATTLYRPQLENKLLRLGYTVRQINGMLYSVVNRYDELIHKLLLEIQADGPDGCLPIIVHRNPTLKRGSSILCRVRKIKTNPEDKTIGLSILITKYCNGDFDGDTLNFYPIMDNVMYELFQPFDMKNNVADSNRPGGLSGHLSLLEAGNSIVSEYLLDTRNDVSKDTLYAKLAKVSVEGVS